MTAAARSRSLVVPREHGAWGILLVPLATGAAVGLTTGGRWLPLIPLTAAALSLFWLRTPLENWIGTSPLRARSSDEVGLVRRAVLALAVLGTASLAWLFADGAHRKLLWIGAAVAVAFLGQAMVKKLWRTARTLPQLIGAAGLTSVAPAAYYVVTGHLDGRALLLWVANFLFACNQIQYVHMRIHAARATDSREKLRAGGGFLAGQGVLAVSLIVACATDRLSWWAAAAFVPLLARGFVWFAAPPRPLVIHALGKHELYLAIAFAVLLPLGMWRL